MNRLNSFCVGIGLTATLLALAVPESADADPTDYRLTLSWPTGQTLTVCAKNFATCQEASRRLWQPLNEKEVKYPPIAAATIDCKPSPGCFSTASNCIQGYNCR